MKLPLVRRFLAGLLLVVLAGCGDGPPPRQFEPASYSYLTPLRIRVGSLETDDQWVPASGVPDISALSPLQPVEALRRMAQDRLIAVGSGGRAVFRIEDAGINRIGDQLQGHLGVLLDIYTSENTRTAYAEARVARASIVTGSGTEGLRSALYDLTKQMMSDMNVEFEYQVRHSLHDWLQDAPDSGPAVPAPVIAQPLDGSPAAPPAPPAPPFTPQGDPLAPIQLSPPPGNLGVLPQSLLPPVPLDAAPATE